MATSDEAWPERAPSDDDDDERRGGGDGDDDERRGGEASRPQSALRIDEARSNLGLGSSATPDAPIFGAGRFLTSGTFLVAAAAKNSWPPAVTTTTDRSVAVTSEPPDR